MAGDDPAPSVRRLDPALDVGTDAGCAQGGEDGREAADRVRANRARPADVSHLRFTEADRAAEPPVPRDDPADSLLQLPEALGVVVAEALKRTERSFETFLTEAEHRMQAALSRLEDAAEPRFGAAADRAFERASGVIRRHGNDLETLTAQLHAEMAEHVARMDQQRATSKLFFDRLGAGLLASAEARVREDAALTAKSTVAELAPQLREIVRDVLREERAEAGKGGGLFRR